MLPRELRAEQFARYPPEARTLAVAHLAALRQLPLSFAPSLLREVIDYDYKFPVERTSIDKELANLSSLSPAQMQEWFQTFSQFALSSKLEHDDWVNLPGQFVEQLSAHLWSTHQLDDFRRAATAYGDRLQAVAPPERPAGRRLGIAVVGRGVESYDAPLFRNLRPHGVYFSNVKAENGFKLLLDGATARAKAQPTAYGHWYVDGGLEAPHSAELTCISYARLEPLRAALLKNVNAEIARPGMGPEELRTHLAKLSPTDLGMNQEGDAVLDRFQLKLFTEGSGTQIFSTTFAQWAAREALRRVQPMTLLVRFAPRQQQKPMNEMLSNLSSSPEVDPVGSLIDAEMAAYYQWINQQRLPGAEESAYLVWFEGHAQALAIGPSLPRGTVSSSAMDLGRLLALTLS
jgi:hypothetical protein